jgi:gas vesicle protein
MNYLLKYHYLLNKRSYSIAPRIHFLRIFAPSLGNTHWIHHNHHDFKEESMKILLTGITLAMIAVSCNKSPETNYQKEKQEANKEYQEDVNEASQQRSEDIKDAREKLQREQKEEAKDYIDESDAARVNKSEQEVEVQESEKQ